MALAYLPRRAVSGRTCSMWWRGTVVGFGKRFRQVSRPSCDERPAGPVASEGGGGWKNGIGHTNGRNVDHTENVVGRDML